MRSSQCVALLLYMTVLAWTGACASGIACAPARRPAVRVICDHAIRNNEYNAIPAQQQALLSSDKLASGQPGRRRHFWNASTDVRRIGTVLVQWKMKAKPMEVEFAVAPAPGMDSEPGLAPGRPASGAGVVPLDERGLSASAASPASGAYLTRQGTKASAALLQPAANNTLSPRVTSSASGTYDARRKRRLTAALIVLIVIAIPLSAFIIRRNKALGITTNYRRARGKKKR